MVLGFNREHMIYLAWPLELVLLKFNGVRPIIYNGNSQVDLAAFPNMRWPFVGDPVPQLTGNV